MSHHDETYLTSRIAYGPSKRSDMDPKAAANYFITGEKAKLNSFLQRPNLSAEDRQRAQHALSKLNHMSVVNANDGGVALLVSDPRTGKKHIEYGYRGTDWTKPSDYATNVQIAMNARTIPRVEQAKAFARETEAMVQAQIPASQLDPSRYYGHSQGGVRRVWSKLL
jgi:hypothetical protein